MRLTTAGSVTALRTMRWQTRGSARGASFIVNGGSNYTPSPPTSPPPKTIWPFTSYHFDPAPFDRATDSHLSAGMGFFRWPKRPS